MAQNWAIVIGVNEYRFLQPLKYAKRDAELMSAFLRDEARFDRIFLFTDDSPAIADKPTEPFRANLLRVLRQIFARPFMQDGDNFWFFFSGHGIRHQEQDYLMPLDGDPEDVTSTGIATATITNYLRSCGADNVVMLLDACRSGGKKSGEGIGKQTEEEARQTGVISIFSCSPDQYSYEVEAIGQGAFTYALLEGLSIRGRCATVERLNQYLQTQVPQVVQQHVGRVRQTPYTIAEPINRSHLILMPQYASLADIATLKNHAFNAEADEDWTLAERLWMRVNAAASGQDTDVVRAWQRIAIKRNTRSQPQVEQRPISAPEAPPASRMNRPSSNEEISMRSPSSAPGSSRRSPTTDSSSQVRSFTDRVRQSPAFQGLTRRQTLKWIPFVVLGGGGVGVATLLNRYSQPTSLSTSTPSPTISPQPSPSTPAASPSVTPASPPSTPAVSLAPKNFEIVTVNAKGEITKRDKRSIQVFTEDLGNGVTLELSKIPAGSFQMGSPETEAERNNSESPQHRLCIAMEKFWSLRKLVRPKLLKTTGCKLGIAHRVLNIPVS
jgi:uncharacterized caspase-like protein